MGSNDIFKDIFDIVIYILYYYVYIDLKFI